MNPFDAAVYLLALIAVVAGFNAGLVRSLATILAYLIAAPFALALTPTVTGYLAARNALAPGTADLVPLGLLLAVGIAFGALMRSAVGAIAGEHPPFVDRLLGALLGGARIGLIAVLLVVVFDRIIPAEREPAWLSGSKLKPYLAAAGAGGLSALPPEAVDYIDRLKRERGI